MSDCADRTARDPHAGVDSRADLKTSGAVKPSLIASIPPDVLDEIAGRLATEVGFGAGPGCIGVNLHTLEPPVRLEVALSWLENHRSVFRRGNVRLDDGTRLFFDPNGFLRVASKVAADANA